MRIEHERLSRLLAVGKAQNVPKEPDHMQACGRVPLQASLRTALKIVEVALAGEPHERTGHDLATRHVQRVAGNEINLYAGSTVRPGPALALSPLGPHRSCFLRSASCRIRPHSAPCRPSPCWRHRPEGSQSRCRWWS